MAALPVPPFPLGQGSGAIVSIDLHVVIGEVTAPALGSLVLPSCKSTRMTTSFSLRMRLAASSSKGRPSPCRQTGDGTRLGLRR